jgi:hypothetical protein
VAKAGLGPCDNFEWDGLGLGDVNNSAGVAAPEVRPDKGKQLLAILGYSVVIDVPFIRPSVRATDNCAGSRVYFGFHDFSFLFSLLIFDLIFEEGKWPQRAIRLFDYFD